MEEKLETPEQAEFRAYCRAWLRENKPEPPPFHLPESALDVADEEQRTFLCAWQKRCYEAGLVGCDYPVAYGGGGHEDFQRIATSEMTRAGVPYLINIIGLGMAAPTILHHGSEEQKKRFLPPLLAADEIWCQGFSEPNAGSDLAGVQTLAVRDGDNWVLNGHKVWTSLAHMAEWMIILCRTSREHKHDGLTFFISPIANTPGVTVRPLIKLTGETGFNEVLFEDVVISDGLRVDDVGKGWTVAMTTLLHERGAGARAGGGGGVSIEERVQQLVRLARKMRRGGRSAWEDPVLRDRIVQMAIRAEGLRQNMRRGRVAALTDHPMRIPLQGKLLSTELMQDLTATALEVEGAHASLYEGDPFAPDAAEWPLGYMHSFGGTIAAGSSEVQRNILGERILGLAKSK